MNLLRALLILWRHSRRTAHRPPAGPLPPAHPNCRCVTHSATRHIPAGPPVAIVRRGAIRYTAYLN